MSTLQSPIPVTLITGFLGSGKTTFVNELTAGKRAKSFAIIENEFGEVGIDQELLIGGSERVFEVNGGCICCTVSDELITYLLNLNGTQQAFNHLIIESTGIAEPLAIAEPFLSHPVIQKKYRLDGIICLVDSEFLEAQLREEEVVARQISAADSIIFNKTDCVEEEYLQKLEQLVRSINPFARMHRAQFARVEDSADLLNMEANQPGLIEQQHQAVDHHHHHLHEQISSYSISFKEPLNYEKFYQWANKLMMFQNSRIYRIKGILNFEREEDKVIFQSVKNKFVMSKGSSWPKAQPSERESKLVFIGRELNKERLERHLRQCMAR